MNQIIHLSKAKLLNTLPINDLCGNNKQKRNIAVLFVVVIVYMAINVGGILCHDNNELDTYRTCGICVCKLVVANEYRFNNIITVYVEFIII